jgi:hypothetical protein
MIKSWLELLSRDDVLQNPLRKNQTEGMIPTLHRSRAFYTSKTLDDSDRALILETLEQARWVVGGPHGAAAKLGFKRTTLIAIMRRLDISRPLFTKFGRYNVGWGTVWQHDGASGAPMTIWTAMQCEKVWGPSCW